MVHSLPDVGFISHPLLVTCTINIPQNLTGSITLIINPLSIQNFCLTCLFKMSITRGFLYRWSPVPYTVMAIYKSISLLFHFCSCLIRYCAVGFISQWRFCTDVLKLTRPNKVLWFVFWVDDIWIIFIIYHVKARPTPHMHHSSCLLLERASDNVNSCCLSIHEHININRRETAFVIPHLMSHEWAGNLEHSPSSCLWSCVGNRDTDDKDLSRRSEDLINN